VNAQGVVGESVQGVVGNELMVGVNVLVVEVNGLEGVGIVMMVEVSELEVEESDDLQLVFLVVVEVSEPKVKENDDLLLVFLVVVMVLVSRALLKALVMVVVHHAHQVLGYMN